MAGWGRAAAITVALAMAASSQTGSAARAAPAKTYTIVIDKMKFGAVPAGLRVGDTIVWVNRDIFRHSATARDGSFDVDLPPAKSAKMVLGRVGSIAFWCKYHPGMKGQLAVAR